MSGGRADFRFAPQVVAALNISARPCASARSACRKGYVCKEHACTFRRKWDTNPKTGRKKAPGKTPGTCVSAFILQRGFKQRPGGALGLRNLATSPSSSTTKKRICVNGSRFSTQRNRLRGYAGQHAGHLVFLDYSGKSLSPNPLQKSRISARFHWIRKRGIQWNPGSVSDWSVPVNAASWVA